MVKTMAQLDFYFCRDEKIELASVIFSMGLKMIPDLSYPAEQATLIGSISEYEPYLSQDILMLIIASDTDQKLLVWGSFERKGVRSHFVRQGYGVASTDFYSPGSIEMTEHRIGPGFLGEQPFYYAQDQTKLYPSERDKLVYKELRAFVKKKSVPARLSKRTFWIGKRTIALCRSASYELMKIGEKNLLNYV
jgi:hypothetical protein